MSTVGGLYGNLVKVTGTESEVGQALQALSGPVGQVDSILSGLSTILPNDSELKKWLTINPGQLLANIINLIKGKTYQTGQYRLGERYNDQILCNGNIGYRDVPDEMVNVARMVFTILFGVRINNDEDLESLDHGVDAYYARPNKKDIPMEAVKRAVFLKQNYFPMSTYNNSCWDVTIFSKFPLVAPIPEMNADPTKEEFNVGKLYNGPLPGGGRAINGVIPVSAQDVLKQMPAGTTFEQSVQQGSNVINTVKRNIFPIVFIVIGVIVLIIIIVKMKR